MWLHSRVCRRPVAKARAGKRGQALRLTRSSIPMSHCIRSAAAVALTAACACLYPALASADDAPPSPTSTIVITAARAPQALTDALPHTTVLSRVDIERSQAVDLAALLAAEAGVQLASNGVRGTPTALFLRGAPTRQVLVLVDGVAISRQDATGQVGIEHLMLDQVERVEIVRGNVSALYGSGAVGGVIQVFTRQGEAAQTTLRAELGARGFAHAGLQSTGTLGSTRWSLGLSSQRDKGLSALDVSQVPQANPDRDGYQQNAATLNLNQALAAGHSVSFGWMHSDSRLAYDSAFGAPADLQDSRTRKQVLRLASDNRINAQWSSRLQLSQQRDVVSAIESGDFGYRDRYQTRVTGLNWNNDWMLSAHTRLAAGLDLQRQSIDAVDGFGGDYRKARNATALFAGLHSTLPSALGPHTVNLQLRRDQMDGVGGHSSASLGWAWQVSAPWKLFASAANAFSAPPLGYLYAPYYGNPALRPELSRSVELGLQWAASGQRARATLFSTRVSDELDFDLQTYTFGNLARTRNQGLEMSYAGRLGATDVRASLTLQRPLDDVSGLRRLRRSDSLASINASHLLGHGWRAGAALRYSGERSDVGNAVLAAYTVIDATLQWDFSRSGQWFARLENLGNARYQTAYGYHQASRGLFAGLRWRLG